MSPVHRWRNRGADRTIEDMRAAYIDDRGPPEAIRYGELDLPRPGPTDVLVDVHATAVNPVDTFVRSGTFSTPMTFPFVIGRDLVGTVSETGAGAADFAVGDLVWCNSLGHGGRQGAAAERAVVPVDRLYHLPRGVPPQESASTVHPTATAYLALVTHGHLRAGETVAVAGGGGNVGRSAIALAAHAGARVVTTARGEDAPHCRSLGAEEVVDYRDEDSWQQLRRACPRGVDLFVETSGTNDLPAIVELLAFRGRAVLLAGARTRPTLPVGGLYLHDRSVRGFAISHATTAELAEAAAHINRLLPTGVLHPPKVETLPLSAAAQAHRRLENGELRGERVVLLP